MDQHTNNLKQMITKLSLQVKEKDNSINDKETMILKLKSDIEKLKLKVMELETSGSFIEKK